MPVSLRGGGTVCGLGDHLGLDAVGITGRDYAFKSCRYQNVALNFKDLVVGDVSALSET